MAGPAVAGVDEAGVAAVRVGEGAPQAMLVRGDGDQVHVVGHQAIGPDLTAGAARGFGEEVTVERVVGVFEERLLAAVAALRDVIGNAGNDDAREPGQGASSPSAARLAERMRLAMVGDGLGGVWWI